MTKRRNKPLPSYLEGLLRSGWTPSPGEVIAIDVLHDDSCRHWRGGSCSCKPALRMRRDLTAEEIKAELERAAKGTE